MAVSGQLWLRMLYKGSIRSKLGSLVHFSIFKEGVSGGGGVTVNIWYSNQKKMASVTAASRRMLLGIAMVFGSQGGGGDRDGSTASLDFLAQRGCQAGMPCASHAPRADSGSLPKADGRRAVACFQRRVSRVQGSCWRANNATRISADNEANVANMAHSAILSSLVESLVTSLTGLSNEVSPSIPISMQGAYGRVEQTASV